MTLSTANPLGTWDEIRKLDAMALIPRLNLRQATNKFH
jgi:hypothetical protein